MVSWRRSRRGSPARSAGAAVAVLVAVTVGVAVGVVGLSACGTATAGGPASDTVYSGGPAVNVLPSPTATATATATAPPGSPAHAADRGTLIIVATVGAPDVGIDVIRIPTPAGLVALTTWVRVDRVVGGPAVVGQRLRIFQLVRQNGMQMQGLQAPAGVLPALMKGRVYELWLRPLTLNDSAIPGTWTITRERPHVVPAS